MNIRTFTNRVLGKQNIGDVYFGNDNYLFEYYNDNPESQTVAGFDNNQEAFNRALQELGILDDDYAILEYDLTDLSDQVSTLE